MSLDNLLFVIVVLFGAGQSNADLPTVEQLEDAIRESREAIPFGALQIKSEFYSAKSGEMKLVAQARRDIWFDDERRRVTWIGQSPQDQKENKIRHVCVPFRTKNDSLWYDGNRVLIKWQNKNDHYNTFLINPKALGLYPLPMSMQFHNQSPLDLPMLRTDFQGTVKAVKWNGKDAYEVLYEGIVGNFKESKTTFRMLVVPEMNYSVPELGTSAIYIDGKSQQKMHVEPKQFGKSGRWFPGKIHFQRVRDGEVIEEDKSEIIWADFESTPAAKVFDLPAMNIPAGTPVVIDFDGKKRVWDGEKIVELLPEDLLSEQFPDLPPESRPHWSSTWLWAATGLSLVGGGFLYGAWRRRGAV